MARRLVRWVRSWDDMMGRHDWHLDETIAAEQDLDGLMIDCYVDADLPQRRQLIIERVGEEPVRGDHDDGGGVELVRARYWDCVCEAAMPYGGDGCGWQDCGQDVDDEDGSVVYYRSDIVDGVRMPMQHCTLLEWREGRSPGWMLTTWSRTVTLWRGTDWAGRPRGE